MGRLFPLGFRLPFGWTFLVHFPGHSILLNRQMPSFILLRQ